MVPSLTPPTTRSSLGHLIGRFVELLVAALAFLISGLTGWLSWSLLWAETDGSTTVATRLAVIYLLVLLAAIVALFGVRLAFPRFRLPGNRIIGTRGMRIFFGIYAIGFIVALVLRSPQAQATGLAVVLGALVVIAFRSTFGK